MKKEVIAHKNPKSPISEVFRTLRTNIQFMNVNKKMKVLLVTSTFPGEGKSWTVANLAVTFAQAGKKVIIIDSDMRKGRQYAVFGLSPKPGLSNFLSQVEIDDKGHLSEDVSNFVQETEIENLYVMTAGAVPPNPSELLVSAQMIRLLDELKKTCDLIIIDGTPSELVTDSVILSRIADSTIIVTAHKVTKKDALDRVIKNIKNVGGNIAGVVINKVPTSSKRYSKRYYYYGEDKMLSEKKHTRRKEGASSFIKSLNKTVSIDFKKANKLNEKIEDNESEKENEFIQKLDNDVQDIKLDMNQGDNINNNTEMNFNEAYKLKDEEIPKSLKNNNKEDTNQDSQLSKDTSDKIREENETLEKTNDILKQINDYLEGEKKKL